MIITLAVLSALTQAPAPQGWVDDGMAFEHPTAVVVTGRVKLNPTAARDAAIEKAANELGYELESRGAEMLEERAPFWLPSFARRLTMDRWRSDLDHTRSLRVVGSNITDRDHGGYRSYQAHLLVEPDTAVMERSLGRLRSQIRDAGRLFLAKCGGTVIFWGLLSLIYLWLDRVTRGYMTWRLRGVLGTVGLALPSLAFVLV